MNNSAQFEVVQILQNSEFWQRTLHALRYADSQIDIAVRNVRAPADSTKEFIAQWQAEHAHLRELYVTVQDKDKELHEQILQIRKELVGPFIRYFLKHCARARSSCYHNYNFASHSPGPKSGRTMRKEAEIVQLAYDKEYAIAREAQMRGQYAHGTYPVIQNSEKRGFDADVIFKRKKEEDKQ